MTKDNQRRVSGLGKKKKRCRLCEIQDNIELYENTLFRFVKGEIKGGKGKYHFLYHEQCFGSVIFFDGSGSDQKTKTDPDPGGKGK